MDIEKIKTISVSLIVFLAFALNTFAQKGNSHLSVGIEVGPTINWQSTGFPLQIAVPFKAYLGTGKHGQLMLRSGWHHFPSLARELDPDIQSLTRTAVPLAFGYRHNFNGWYLEGSFGVAYDIIITRYQDPFEEPEGDVSMEPHIALEIGKRFPKYDIGMAVYNHGNSPFNIVFIGLKSLYRIGK
ncbi:MAG: hypothetical protein ACXIUQ_04870 [Cecembia sp.]